MPTSAFFNLSEDKKTKLIEAAKKEFANNLFEVLTRTKIPS